MNACWVSQSISALTSFKYCQWMCLKQYVLWRNDISFKKNTEKVVFDKWKTWCKLLSSSILKKFCASFCHAPNIHLKGHKIYMHKKNIVVIWKQKGSFLSHNLVHNFFKKYHKVSVSSTWYIHATKTFNKLYKKLFQPLNYLYVD